ncbi:ABC transporter substrate-binding protein [Pseudomonas auratipiscis]|uniref:ABC transporter substrate-binding protein n=1 Tax=Pseudomonas auratipiscis TaxID=3115853 RepID=A0AB35WP16_9PSED|nr:MULTISPECIES: ABC transporter substrate-binding protein [unclassified Pseudomonas]MEE1865845.1 ABC transporter substrate-binding protein [Pseudomonas sp. 120P]MEE1956986.1 ABC transporter substrate-binding protein [Pseudomonas sp. 119P]
MNQLSSPIRQLFIGAIAALCFSAAHASEITYRVGATPTGAPFTFLDIKSNSIQGVMVDVANALGKVEGFDCVFEQTGFSALIPSLTSRKIDFISASMLKTEERSKIVDFTDPVYAFGEGLIVRNDDSSAYPDLASLKGEVVGVQAGTTFYDIVKGAGEFKEVRIYDSVGEMILDLSLGRIKAGVVDEPELAYQIRKGLVRDVKLAKDYRPAKIFDLSLVVRKGDAETVKSLNKAIASIKADGTLEAILKKWGLDSQVTP